MFITKYREWNLVAKAIEPLHAIFRVVCADFEPDSDKCDGERDHVHLLVRYPPKYAVSGLVNSLEGVCLRRLRAEQPDIAKYGKSLWSPSCFAGSVGGAPLDVRVTGHLADLSVADIGVALRRGDLSAKGLIEAHLERIEQRDRTIGAFVHVAGDDALAAARAADAALAAGEKVGPLHGIPFAIKDIIDVAGWPVRWGSRLQQHRIAPMTAPVVQSLIDAGAIPLGLVATYELASVGPDSGSLYPAPRNPWNHDRITGGSSSGSAAAVAAGLVRFALGTDTGGSIRSPSAYCGVVGLKPTFGALSIDGVMPLAPSLDHVGVVARTATDAAAVYAVLFDRPTSTANDVAGICVAYGRGWCRDDAAHADLLQLMDDAASVLTLCGMTLALRELPDYADIEAAAGCVIHAEQFATHGAAVSADPGAVGRMAAGSILAGACVSADELAAAHRVLDTFRADLDAVFEDHDVLILPTTMTGAAAFSDFADGVSPWTAMRTMPFNVTGHPALSVPMGFVDGLPLGLQVVGSHGDEATVLHVGAAFEAATDHGIAVPGATGHSTILPSITQLSS